MSMNNNSNQQNLCKQGCGFYGNAQNMDMCSKCYQNFLKTSNQEEAPRSQSSSQYASQISINEMYLQNAASSLQNRSKLVDSNIQQFKENRKRAAQSDIETIHKVPKTCNKEDSDQYAAEVNQITEKFAIDSTAPSNTDEKHDPDDLEASPANSIHSSGPTMKKPRRCEFCRRKVGLTGFDCRCGGHYCAVHRYSDKHSCTFDYQAHGQEQIKHQNPMICGSKIKKI